MERVKQEPLVRRATEADIPAIRAVLATTWRDTYRTFVPLEAIEQATAAWHAPPVLAAELTSAATFTGVAEDGSGLVGMVTAHERADAVEIARLYVLPGAQRRGIGRRLLAAAIAAFPAQTLVWLGVEEQNGKGRAFYAKEGFVAVRRQPVEAFGTTLHVVVMERRPGGVGDPSIA